MPPPKKRIKGVRELKKKVKIKEEGKAVLHQTTTQAVSFIRPQMLASTRRCFRRLEEALPDVPQQKKPEEERLRPDEPVASTPFSY